jgi:LPXTG-motif cell wall-anchored protein
LKHGGVSHDEVTNGDDHHSVRASSSSSHTAAVALSVVGIGMVGGVALLVSRKRNRGKIHLEEPLTCNTNDAYDSI